MVFKKKKGFMVTMPILPWLIIIVFAIILVVALLALIKTASLISVDNNRASSNALQTMLNSNDCTPITKLPFKDVIAAGIGEGVTKRADPIVIKYGAKEEGLLFGFPLSVDSCIARFIKSGVMPWYFYFYVDQSASSTSACPSKICFQGTYVCRGTSACSVTDTPAPNGVPLTTLAEEYIVLPNGDVAKVVLKSP